MYSVFNLNPTVSSLKTDGDKNAKQMFIVSSCRQRGFSFNATQNAFRCGSITFTNLFAPYLIRFRHICVTHAAWPRIAISS